jgi:hypothetical protein
MKQLTVISITCALSLVISGCATSNVIVDPASISNSQKYAQDLRECESIAQQYDLSGQATGGAALGGLAVLGTAAAVLATGGMYLLPAGALLAGGTGAAIFGGNVVNKETRMRDTIRATCLTERGYRVYNP